MKILVSKTKASAFTARHRAAPIAQESASVWSTWQASVRGILRGHALQPKLKVGAPNDPYEQEADQVADAVARMGSQEIANPSVSVQSASNQSAPYLLASNSRRIASVPDDRMADWVTRAPAPTLAERQGVTAKVDGQRVHRRCAECEAKLRRQPAEEDEEWLQAKAQEGSFKPPSAVSAQATNLEGGGQPLPASLRRFFEPRFGYDFGRVRVHTDAAAAQSAQHVNALSYTVGHHVVFNRGQYAPETTAGKRLLAHELTHVMQQSQASGVSPWVQRAQVGRVHTPKGGAPHFIYELDSDRSTFSQLAGYYGVTVADIQKMNPKAKPSALRLAQPIKVPAFNPPPADSQPTKAGTTSVTQSTSTHLIPIRWNSGANSNLVGRLKRGSTVFTFSSGAADVPLPSLQNAADGVIQEMERRNLIAGGILVYAYPPAANVRASNAPVPASDVDLIARMIWGEQRSQGVDAMTGAAWITRNRYNAGWGSYSQIITAQQFQGIASKEDVKGLSGADLKAWNDAQTIAQEVVDGTRADPTGGAQFFGNGADMLKKMQACAKKNKAFSHGTIAGTNFHFSNGDYTASSCTVQ